MADPNLEGALKLAKDAADVAGQADILANKLALAEKAAAAASHGGGNDFMFLLIIFVLAIFVGYYVVWRVTPALHSPLMAVTNAVSSVIIVGAILSAGPIEMTSSKVLGFFAVLLASVNIFGGFLVTQRMLAMFKKKER